jgi:hypothetical protein
MWSRQVCIEELSEILWRPIVCFFGRNALGVALDVEIKRREIENAVVDDHVVSVNGCFWRAPSIPYTEPWHVTEAARLRRRHIATNISFGRSFFMMLTTCITICRLPIT